MFCHVRDRRNGEGKVKDGETTKPKAFYEDMLATSLTLTTKQSCKTQARPAAARCMMARLGIEHGSLRCRSTLVSRNYRAGASSPPRRKRHQDTECRQKRSSHEASQKENDVASWEMDSAREVLASRRTHARGSVVEAGQVNETCKLELQPACMAVTAAKFKPWRITPGQVNLSLKLQ